MFSIVFGRKHKMLSDAQSLFKNNLLNVKLSVIWDFKLCLGLLIAFFRYEICSQSWKLLSFSFFILRVSLTRLSINATDLYCILFSFYFAVRQGIFFATVYSKKMTSFLKQRRESKWKYTQMKSIAFTFIVLFFASIYLILLCIIIRLSIVLSARKYTFIKLKSSL